MMNRKLFLRRPSPAYRPEKGENRGCLIKHNVFALPHKSEVDQSLTYSDYYFIEAMFRYKKWYTKDK
ncbi:MAG: glycosyl hydrolase family 88 [Chitinophagaceae bacterium]